MNNGALKELNNRVTFAPGNVWSLAVGNRYLRADPSYGADSGENIFYGSAFYRLNENWAVRASLHYEAKDHTMEEQYYTLYRDFRSWTGALTVRMRDSRTSGTDFTIAFTLSLKALPRYKVGQDADRPSLLLGG
jgi:hypothetical protein